ncbi:HdeD family acid-resistance protein, partial [Streptomyces beijiangensis]|nr:HdeD family acid-resistance protein [Streptomyces beijiangensis]
MKSGFRRLAARGVILVIAGLTGLVRTGVAPLTTMVPFGRLLLIGGMVSPLHAVR